MQYGFAFQIININLSNKEQNICAKRLFHLSFSSPTERRQPHHTTDLRISCRVPTRGLSAMKLPSASCGVFRRRGPSSVAGLLRRTGPFGYDAVIRLSFGATSRRSATIVYAFIHGQAHGLLRRRIKRRGFNGSSLRLLLSKFAVAEI